MLNPEKEAYFENMLTQNLSELLTQSGKAISGSGLFDERHTEFGDLALFESNANISLHITERQHWLIEKIKNSLEKLRTGEFGICEECGEEISEKRLMARPVAFLCIDCKRAEEKAERLRA
jgi:DnaK suppressor protein